MPWVYPYGWVIPLIFLGVFLFFFFFNWRRFGRPGPPNSAWCSPRANLREEWHLDTKIEKLSLEIEDLKKSVNDSNKEDVQKKITELEKELKDLKDNL